MGKSRWEIYLFHRNRKFNLTPERKKSHGFISVNGIFNRKTNPNRSGGMMKDEPVFPFKVKKLIYIILLYCGAAQADYRIRNITDVNYDLHGKNIKCIYDFVIPQEDGTLYASKKIDGIIQHTFKENDRLVYSVDFKAFLDLLPGLDRSLNPDTVEVEAYKCEVLK